MSAKHMPSTMGPEVQADDKLGKITLFSFGIGIVSLIASGAIGQSHNDQWANFLHSYLTNFSYFLSIALGALFFVTLQHLTRAGWSVTLRRQAELICNALPILALLFLPIIIPTLMGNHELYAWTNHALAKTDHMLHLKEPYLNIPFFAGRCAFYFLFWVCLARYFNKKSLEQDESGEVLNTLQMEKVSAPGMVVLALTISFAAVDLVMTLEFHWFSTIIGVYYFAGCFMSCLACLILGSKYLQSQGKIGEFINVEHYHDLGKLLFGFVFFWGYIGFSQYMLIWYASMPEGTQWYIVRKTGEWNYMVWFLILGHFFIPYVGLISRHAKRRTRILACWAVWLLFFHWVDHYFMVMPTMSSHGHALAGEIPFSILDLTCFLGIGGMFVGTIGYAMRGKKLIPIQDPRLKEALSYENF